MKVPVVGLMLGTFIVQHKDLFIPGWNYEEL
jgi:hypothetical protein